MMHCKTHITNIFQTYHKFKEVGKIYCGTKFGKAGKICFNKCAVGEGIDVHFQYALNNIQSVEMLALWDKPHRLFEV